MKREIRQYSFLFPFWLMVFKPSVLWFLILPANFVWDSVVLILALKLFKVNGVRETWKKAIIKVWFFGFLADLAGAGILFLSGQEWGDWWKEYIAGPVARNPYDNWYSLLYTVSALLITGFLAYLFNRYMVFQRIDMERKKRRTLSFILAAFSVPYLFLIPTGLFEQPHQGIYFFTNHIVPEGTQTVQVVQCKEGKETVDAVVYTQVKMLVDAVNHASPGASLPEEVQDETYSLRFSEGKTGEKTEVELYFGSGQDKGIYFTYNGQAFRVLREDEQGIRDLINYLIQNGFSYRYTIVDQSVMADTALEWIASDEKYDYYLSSRRSDHIVLCFENGTVLSLREALDKGVVDVSGLIRNGLDVVPLPRDQEKLTPEEGN